MDAKRKKPSTLSGIAPEATPRRDSDVGQSPAAPGSLIVPPPNHAPSAQPRATSFSAPRASGDAELTWKSLLGLEEPPPRSVAPGGGRKPQSETRTVSSHRVLSDAPKSSAGYYSSRPAPEFVGRSNERPSILPPPPRGGKNRSVPLDLEPISSDGSSAVAPEPAPVESRSARRSSAPPPRIFFPPHIRQQADGWLETGSLSLPNCSSPRHARAVQRALLLALLAEPGYKALPLGLKQRVGWLLSPGWERVPTGSSLSELNDLMTVLGVPAEIEARDLLLTAAQALVPDPLPLGRPPSSYPPARR